MLTGVRWPKDESRRDDGIEAAVIVTPNNLQAEQALAFVEAGFHVICDKPLTATLDEAIELHRAVKASDRVFAVTYRCSGYPMVREARQRIKEGDRRRGPFGCGELSSELVIDTALKDRREKSPLADRPEPVQPLADVSLTSEPTLFIWRALVQV